MVRSMDEELLAFVEIPKGSRNKYEFSEELGRIILDRFLHLQPSTRPTTAT